MASRWIPIDEVKRQVLDNDSDDDLDGNYSDGSEQDLSIEEESSESSSHENSSQDSENNGESGI